MVIRVVFPSRVAMYCNMSPVQEGPVIPGQGVVRELLIPGAFEGVEQGPRLPAGQAVHLGP